MLDLVPPIEQERVKLGAEWLDGVHPDWYHDIDLERLSTDSTQDDVLGQLQLGRLPLHEETYRYLHDFGFDADDIGDTEQFYRLDAAWRGQIRKRLRG